MSNKDIDETAAALANVPEKTKASITSQFALSIAQIKESKDVAPCCIWLLKAGYYAVEMMRDAPNLKDDETGRFLMECVIDRVVAASGITNGALLRGPDVGTVH